MRKEHEEELAELHQKMDAEKQTKAKMQQEVELMKQQYEDKLKVRKNIFRHLKTRAFLKTISHEKALENRRSAVARLSRANSIDPDVAGKPQQGGPTSSSASSPSRGGLQKQQQPAPPVVNQVQQAAMRKLKQVSTYYISLFLPKVCGLSKPNFLLEFLGVKFFLTFLKNHSLD